MTVDTARPKGDLCTGIVITMLEGKVALIIEAKDRDPIVAVMTAREAHHLRSRIHKAANDASAMAARAGAT